MQTTVSYLLPLHLWLQDTRHVPQSQGQDTEQTFSSLNQKLA